jgi:hypothetical protein
VLPLYHSCLMDLIKQKKAFSGLLSGRLGAFSRSLFCLWGKAVEKLVEKLLISLTKKGVFGSYIYRRAGLYLASLGIE